MTLAEFLAARLDEDETAARAELDIQERVFSTAEFTVHYEWSRQTRHTSGGSGVSTAPGAPSPARVLREVAAKRHLVDAHHPNHDPCDAHDPATMESEPCEVLTQLAFVYSDHPDYRQEWAP